MGRHTTKEQSIIVDKNGKDLELTTLSNLPVEVINSALPTGASTALGQSALLTELQAKADLTETQPVETLNNGHICLDNSTSTPLGIAGVFPGDWQDTLDYNVVIIGVVSDQDSATDGLEVQWSADGVSVTQDDTFTILANNGKVFTFTPPNRYFKIVYTNGAVAQTTFNIQAIFKKGGFKASSHRIDSIIVGQDDAELVKAAVTGQDTDTGDYVNVGTVVGQQGNNLLVSVDQVETTTNSLKVISYSHAELHSGDQYTVRSWETLDNNATLDILMVTPNTASWSHMVVSGGGEDGAIEIDIYEGTTTSADGTLANTVNRNRNFPDDNTTLVYTGPTITTDGGLLFEGHFGSGKTIGGDLRDTQEMVLRQNTKYLFRITNATTSDNIVNWSLDWYEHTNS